MIALVLQFKFIFINKKRLKKHEKIKIFIYRYGLKPFDCEL